MGRNRRSRTHSNPKKNQATTQKTKRYRRDIDQIHDDIKDGGKQKFLEDLAKKDLEDLPGLGKFGCVSCSRYFADAIALETHNRGKPHKRQLKKLEEEPYTIEESLRAAGVGVDKGEYGKRKEKEAKEEEERQKQGEAVMTE
ncbi:Bud20p [Sporobolomyces salmoneus]|uniref:Bud20p n=1 Tax=Sporobolomyces salmoneus TaxID=183962 RepID=UPI0031715B1A